MESNFSFEMAMRPLILFGAIILSLFVSSCTHESADIGIETLPSTDFFTILNTDTLSVRSYTISLDEAFETGMQASSFLGKGEDRYFGTTTAEFVSQLRLSTSEFAANFHHVVDSVALNLRIEKVTGSTVGPHYLSFREIADDLSKDSTYYANSTINHTDLIVTDIPLPQLNRSTPTDVRVNIPTSFGDYLVRQPESLTNSPDVKTNFIDFFKGLHFVLESEEDNAFLEFSLDPPDVSLIYYNYFTVYMTDTTDNSSTQFFVILDAVNENVRFNIFSNDFSTAEQPIDHINDHYLDSLTYIHRWGAVSAEVLLPGLESIKNDPIYDNIIITKARLLFPIMTDGAGYTAETIPDRFFLKYYKEDGSKEYVHDFSSVSPDFYWGTINSSNYIEFNIPTFVQAYLEDETNVLLPKFEISLLQSSANSAILKSNSNSTPPLFELTFIAE